MNPAGQSSFGARCGRFARRIASYFTVGTYMLNAPIGYVLLAGLSFLWRRRPMVRIRRLQAITSRAYRFMHDWLRLVRITNFNHRGALPDLPEGPFVAVANHPTLMDITAIVAVLGRACTIAKPQMYDRRLLRPLLAGAGHIRGPTADPLSVEQVLEDSVQRLRDGLNMVVFPEGTRSPPNQLLPFGRIAFEIACRAQVPVVSIGVRCEPVYLSKEVSVFRPPHPTAQLTLEMVAVDDPAEAGLDSRALLQIVEGRFRSWHAGTDRTE